MQNLFSPKVAALSGQPYAFIVASGFREETRLHERGNWSFVPLVLVNHSSFGRDASTFSRSLTGC